MIWKNKYEIGWCDHCKTAIITCQRCKFGSCTGGGCDFCKKDFAEFIKYCSSIFTEEQCKKI